MSYLVELLIIMSNLGGYSMNITRKRSNLVITIPDKWNNLTMDDFFRTALQAPKKLIHQWRMSKNVTLNDVPVKWSSILKEGDELSIPVFDEEIENPVVPNDLGISILYEDDHLLIANKPAGMDTHPSSEEISNTLLNGVAYHLKATGQNCIIKHIHRLDKDTTGAVIFAKNRLAGSILDRMLEEREISRTYLAIAEGLIEGEKGTIRKNIGRDRHHPTRRRVSPSGQAAVTHYKVEKRWPDKKMTLISCTLESGRTHQIRVHLSSINHPLAGDVLYGGKRIFPRQALHARKVTFIHPLTEQAVDCVAPFLDVPPIF
jgi:23S rRNA pseudouridine1911/1915/1917 synthase